MPTPPPAIVCSGLTFSWPDGTPVFTGLSLVIGPGRTGLTGLNGSGKSTLLRLVAGELTPGHGSVQVAGDLGYVPQNVTLAGTRVDEALGIAAIRAAVAAIEAGDASEENFARVGTDWDAEERARATLDRLGLEQVPLDRRIDELSGGESVLLCLAAQFLRRPAVLLLDEPTNNLDLDARRRLYDAVRSWTGAMVMVSHDRELLDPGLSVVQNVARAAPAATVNQIRAQLARFLFRGRRADQAAGTLSGGELFRAALATLLLAEPPPQLLLLDEPTNNLDMASVRQLSGALRSYPGALLVASHDVPFLRDIGITRWLQLDGDLADIDPL